MNDLKWFCDCIKFTQTKIRILILFIQGVQGIPVKGATRAEFAFGLTFTQHGRCTLLSKMDRWI